MFELSLSILTSEILNAVLCLSAAGIFKKALKRRKGFEISGGVIWFLIITVAAIAALAFFIWVFAIAGGKAKAGGFNIADMFLGFLTALSGG